MSRFHTRFLGFNNIHQADVLGIRYIKNDGRFFSFYVMDLYNRHISISMTGMDYHRFLIRGNDVLARLKSKIE